MSILAAQNQKYDPQVLCARTSIVQQMGDLIRCLLLLKEGRSGGTNVSKVNKRRIIDMECPYKATIDESLSGSDNTCFSLGKWEGGKFRYICTAPDITQIIEHLASELGSVTTRSKQAELLNKQYLETMASQKDHINRLESKHNAEYDRGYHNGYAFAIAKIKDHTAEMEEAAR